MDEQKLYKIADSLTLNDLTDVIVRFMERDMEKDQNRKVKSLIKLNDGSTIKIKIKREVINHGE